VDSALGSKSSWVWEQTLSLHKAAPETRVASSLSAVEILTALYYGDVLRFRPSDPAWEGRDRLIASKGHGSIAMYPILADLGFFPKRELERACKGGSILGGIPDPVIPGFETVNGSLGHGIGVGAGVSCALKMKGSASSVFVLAGDGEMNEGSMWEGVMFAAQRKLDNLVLIIDCNKVSMLGFCADIIDLEPFESKLKSFGWDAMRGDGHDAVALADSFRSLRDSRNGKPKAFIADTLKGNGVKSLVGNPLSHVATVSASEIDGLLKGRKASL